MLKYFEKFYVLDPTNKIIVVHIWFYPEANNFNIKVFKVWNVIPNKKVRSNIYI